MQEFFLARVHRPRKVVVASADGQKTPKLFGADRHKIKVSLDQVDFTAVSTDNEQEIAKLVAMCMHFTMVSRARDDIKAKTMKLMSEDQTIIKATLHAIIVKDYA